MFGFPKLISAALSFFGPARLEFIGLGLRRWHANKTNNVINQCVPVSSIFTFVPYLGLIGSMLIGSQARAVLTLTHDAPDDIFTLSTFADSFLNSGPGGSGPMGIAYRTDGAVLVADAAAQDLYALPSHADNQHAGVLYNYGAGFGPSGLAQVQVGGGYNYYMTDQPHNTLVQISGAGPILGTVATIATPNAVTVFPGLSLAPPGPHTGHLFVSSSDPGPTGNAVYEVDPASGTKTTFIAPGAGLSQPDGMSFSPDGSILYVANWDPNVHSISAFSTTGATGTHLYDITGPAGHLDGISIGLGTLNGYIYANYNEGDLWQFAIPGGPHAGEPVYHVATGGSRGDFVTMDPAVPSGGPFGFPSLLVTQTDRVMRLDPPGGGFYSSNMDSITIGSPSPEPSSILLVSLGGWVMTIRGGRNRMGNGKGTQLINEMG